MEITRDVRRGWMGPKYLNNPAQSRNDVNVKWYPTGSPSQTGNRSDPECPTGKSALVERRGTHPMPPMEQRSVSPDGNNCSSIKPVPPGSTMKTHLYTRYETWPNWLAPVPLCPERLSCHALRSFSAGEIALAVVLSELGSQCESSLVYRNVSLWKHFIRTFATAVEGLVLDQEGGELAAAEMRRTNFIFPSSRVWTSRRHHQKTIQVRLSWQGRKSLVQKMPKLEALFCVQAGSIGEHPWPK
ncbi:hypothetical protein B0H14DRAFT_3735207 [Mycena olivaceomarginata]|nr:hypothetical protein B0H14DRAFT_3735207 [Mycena olivaceomarginata]